MYLLSSMRQDNMKRAETLQSLPVHVIYGAYYFVMSLLTGLALKKGAKK